MTSSSMAWPHFVCWGLNSIFDGTTAPYTTERCGALDDVPSSLNSSLQRQVQTFVSVPFVARNVSHLHCVRRPSAIPRLVISVIVYAVNRMLRRWTRSHICKEGHEVVLPSFADGYPATSPIHKVASSRVMAAPYHLAPRFVLRCSVHPVLGEPCPRVVGRKASARFAASTTQVGANNRLNVPAITDALPCSLRSLIWRSTNHGPSMEPLPAKVLHFCHAYLAGPNAKQIAIAGDYSI